MSGSPTRRSLKFFFSEGITNDEGEEVSNREIKKILSNAIEAVDRLIAVVEMEPELVAVAQARFDGEAGGAWRKQGQQVGEHWKWTAPTKFGNQPVGKYSGWLEFELKASVVSHK